MKRPKFGGRKPGSVNKITRDTKEALELAFEEMGGTDALVAWGKLHPTEFYRIWSRLLPRELKAEVNNEPNGKVIICLPDNGRNPEVHKPNSHV